MSGNYLDSSLDHTRLVGRPIPLDRRSTRQLQFWSRAPVWNSMNLVGLMQSSIAITCLSTAWVAVSQQFELAIPGGLSGSTLVPPADISTTISDVQISDITSEESTVRGSLSSMGVSLPDRTFERS